MSICLRQNIRKLTTNKLNTMNKLNLKLTSKISIASTSPEPKCECQF